MSISYVLKQNKNTYGDYRDTIQSLVEQNPNQMSFDEYVYIYELIKSNIDEMADYIKESNSNCEISTYHLVLDNSKEKEIIELYKKNIVEKVKADKSYVWRMHNWSGNYDNKNPREVKKKNIMWKTFCARNHSKSWRIGG